MFLLEKYFTKRLFAKFYKFLLQTGDMLLEECAKASPFDKKKVVFPSGEKE